MKKYLLLFLFLFGAFAIQAQEKLFPLGGLNYFEYCKQMDDYFLNEIKEGKRSANNNSDDEYKAYQRWKWYWKTRVDQNGKFPDIIKGLTDAKNVLKAAPSLNWVNISPVACDGGYNGMGRTTCIAFHPTDSNTFYVGAPIGGLWKTIDGGLTYLPLTDSLPFVSVGNCVVDPINPNTIYISVGDNNGFGDNSMGVYKSTDGGNTWNTTGLSWTLSQDKTITDLAMDPNNNSVLYVAASDGLYKTLNGGASWSVIRSGRHVQIRFQPGSSNLYVSTYDPWSLTEVFRSTNGGTSWTQITNFNNTNNLIRMAVTPADPSRIAILNTSNNQLYVSTNYGAGLNLVGTCPANKILMYSPTDTNKIYCGQLDVYQSVNEGGTWNQLTSWYGNPSYEEVHADQRNSFYSPILTDKLYFCNDGGVYVFSENANSWIERSNGLVISQFYRIENSQQNSQILIGGSQDNGGRLRKANGIWADTHGGDGMEVAVDPLNDSILYSCNHNGILYRSLNGWANNTVCISANIPGGTPNGGWVTPYVIDPSNRNAIVAGYEDVWRSTNRGNSWTKISNNLTQGMTLDCIAVAPSDSSTIYASFYSSFYVTNNLGASWTTYFSLGEEITSIVVHPQNPDIVWITFGRYTSTKKVYVSTNRGATWTNISSGLPNIPINNMIHVNGSVDCKLFIATDAGVFYRDSISNTWYRYGNGLPNTSVTDFSIYYPEMKLRAATFGRGIWEIDIVPIVLTSQSETTISQSLNIFPNPSRNQITINYQSVLKDNISLRIINSLGQIIMEGVYNNNQLENKTIDISDYTEGCYMLLIQQGDHIINKKIIKQ